MDYGLPSNSFHGVLRRRVAALSIRVHRAGRREGPPRHLAGDPRDASAERSILDAGPEEHSCRVLDHSCRERTSKCRTSTSHFRQLLAGAIRTSSLLGDQRPSTNFLATYRRRQCRGRYSTG